MRIISAVEDGIYDEDTYADVDPELLVHSYGVDARPGPLNHHVGDYSSEDEDGGEHADDDEEDSSDLEFDDQCHGNGDVPNPESNPFQAAGISQFPPAIVDETRTHIKHPPVKVPRHSNPFVGRPEQEQAFLSMLNDPNRQNEHIPIGFNVHRHEWDNGQYPTHQGLKIGARRRVQLVELPAELWLPRAQRWARGVNILYSFFDIS
jgi:hypothetical protein